MQGPSKEAKHKALAAFVDIDAPPKSVIDRSTLERFATCPAQGVLVASGKVNNGSLAAAAGEEVHQAFGNALAEYVASHMSMTKTELRHEVENNILNARPDVQPEALKGVRASIWHWTDFISRINPENILRFDGGRGDRTGQLAWDVDIYRITSELDLLHAGPSPELLHEVDYKSGWKNHGAADVANSFQFQMHAVLVLENYPKVNGLEVRVWNSRFNRLSPAVYFWRDSHHERVARIRAALGFYYRHQGVLPELAETWPAAEKCGICPAAALCPAAGHVADLVARPAAFLASLVAIEQRAKAMKDMLSAYVDETGQDIVTESGLAFGRNKPASGRKPPTALYQLKGTDNEQAE